MLNTVDVIEIAKVTVSVVIKAIELNQENDIELPNKISIEARALEWVNSTNYTGINLAGFTEYVYGMCGGYAFEAEALMGLAGYVVDPSSGGGARVPEQYSAFASTGSVSIIFAQAIGKTLLYASRGGIDVGEIILSGVPVLNQVRWDIATGTLTVAATVPFVTGEYVKIIVY
jgi:hypothetical protein